VSLPGDRLRISMSKESIGNEFPELEGMITPYEPPRR